TSLCYNDTAIIHSRLSVKDPNFTYEWLLDNILDQQKSDSFRIVVKGNHNLNLTVKASGDCRVSKSMQVYYHPLPNFSIVGDTVFNKANYIVLSASKAFNTYKWSNGASTKDNGFWAYTLGAPGVHSQTLEVSDSNGCKSSETHWFRTNGLTDVNTSAKTQWQIYPNPGSDIVNIIAPEKGILKLYSAEGKLIKTFSVAEGMNKADVSDLSAGYYLLQCGSFRSTLLIE
ncbi:MAG: T9SS type A sorting domain-containing protein, partial [Chitinophagaceae bacterium]